MNIPKNGRSKWLMIVFITNYDDQDLSYVLQTKKELEQAVTTDADILLFEQEVINKFTPRVKIVTRATIITKTETGHDSKPLSKQRFSFDNGDCWIRLFSWIQLEYPTQRLILAILSHGCAVGVWNESVRRYEPTRGNYIAWSSSYLKYANQDWLKDRSFTERVKGIVYVKGGMIIEKNEDYPCNAIEMLWMSELGDAMERGLGVRKIDLVLMVNCFTQTFDAGWLLRKNVNYMAAPQTLFQWHGYSYSRLLTLIGKDPAISGGELAKSVIPGFIKKDKETRPRSAYFQDNVVSVVNLSAYECLKILFEDILEQILSFDQEQMKTLVKKRLKHLHNMDELPPDQDTGNNEPKTTGYVDLIGFFHIVADVDSKNIKLATTINNFKKIFTSSCRSGLFIGDNLRAYDADDTNKKKYRISGTSMFLPSQKMKDPGAFQNFNCAYFGNSRGPWAGNTATPMNSPFTETSLWDDFLKQYQLYLPDSQP